jgi:cell division protein FtsI/penicillin-binding protein 2
VPEAQAGTLREKLRAANLRGIYFEHDATRVYPNGSMLCHVIGFTDFDHRGIQGVEASMEEYLHGQDGFASSNTTAPDRRSSLIAGQERPQRDGYQVHLTIDLSLQNIVENEIDAAMRNILLKKPRLF